MFRKYLILVIVIIQIGCSSSPPKPSTDSFEVEIESSSRDQFRNRSFFIDLEATKLGLVDRHCAVLFASALSVAGYRAAMVQESAEIRIEISYTRENPITGTPVLGSLTPYRHQANIKAFGPNHLEWELNLTAYTKSASKAELCPFFAAAGIDFYGLSSNGPQKRTIRREDPKVQRLLYIDKKQGLLE